MGTLGVPVRDLHRARSRVTIGSRSVPVQDWLAERASAGSSIGVDDNATCATEDTEQHDP